MLTKEAFNALLKTLEEPPAHVIFILATTELQPEVETAREKAWLAWEELAQWHEQWERLPKDDANSQPMVQGIRAVDRGVEIGLLPSHALRLITTALLKGLDDMKTPNCFESVMAFDGGLITVEVRRLHGKSMGQLRAEAIHERNVARAELAETKAAGCK